MSAPEAAWQVISEGDQSRTAVRRTLWLHALITVALLGVFQFLIWQKESLLARGQSVLLKLAPVDPRSLMQGDYMRLDYEVSRSIFAQGIKEGRGRAVIALNGDGVATFVRLEDGTPLSTGERLLNFHLAGHGRVRLGAESYFFQEGSAERFERAQYGELKVAPDGSSVLVGLRDAERRVLSVVPASGKKEGEK